MNPVFWLAVICAGVLLWFISSFAFKGIGKFAYRLYDDAMEEIKDPEKVPENESKENKTV